MKNSFFILLALFWIYFNIGGLATTNILRLTKGNTRHVLSSECKCDNCGMRITALFQLPIISYMLSMGKCRSCGCKIPVYPMILEAVIFFGMSFISALFSFATKGVFYSYIFYEIIRILVISIRGKRTDKFISQYIIAILAMVPFFLLTLIVSGLYSEVC